MAVLQGKLLGSASPAEISLLELSIGKVVLDKTRGVDTSLAQTYASVGGTDPVSERAAAAVDQRLAGRSLSAAAAAIASATGESVDDLVGSASGAEIALVERTIGRVLIQQLHGQFVDPVRAYEELGGGSQRSIQALQAVTGRWSQLDLTPLAAQIAQVVR